MFKSCMFSWSGLEYYRINAIKHITCNKVEKLIYELHDTYYLLLVLSLINK